MGISVTVPRGTAAPQWSQREANLYGDAPMPVRIEIELTSSAPDGSWTWRAAGAREPRGVLDGSILPSGSSVGDQLRVETEHDVDGIRVLSVVPNKEKAARAGLLELLPSEERFEPVAQHRAPGGRSDGPRRPRRDDDRGERREGDRRDRRPPREGGDRPPRSGADERGGDRPPRRDGEDRRRQRPHFTPPPEVPQRPKPKRLRPGKLHRTEVLAATPEEQRTVAELTLQGMAAVRQRLREDNARLKAEGKPEMPEAAVMKMAEDLLPRLRVADWLDRAEAAQRQLEHLDLRDLRSVVAASDDPLVARDETTRALAASLKAALVTKQDEELALWLADVEAALEVGRVVRALRLSSQPPKAGVPFPGALATRLAEATTASLQPTDGPDRWSAVLEAVAFSPVRILVVPAAAPEARSDELTATVKRLGPLLPQIAALFGVEVPTNAPTPKPLRPTARRDAPKKQAARPPRPPTKRDDAPTAAPAPTDDAAPPDDASPTTAGAPVEETAPVESAPVEDALVAAPAPVEPAAVEDGPVVSAPVVSAPVVSAPVESAPVESAPVESAPVESAPVESAPVESAPVESAPVVSAGVEDAAVESARVEGAQVEAPAPVVPTAVDDGPVEAPAPVESAAVDDGPVAAPAPVVSVGVEDAPVEVTAPVESAPVESVRVESAPVEESGPAEPPPED
jgi:hypothetical protein